MELSQEKAKAQRDKLELELLKNPKFKDIVLADKARRMKEESSKDINDSLTRLIEMSIGKFKPDSPTEIMMKNTEAIHMIAESMAIIMKAITEKDETHKYIQDLKVSIEKLVEKKIEPPIVNIPTPKVYVETPEINVPAPTVIDQTKVVPETVEAKESKTLLEKILAAVMRKAPTAFRILNEGPEEAIPVVLTSASKKGFYDAMFQALSAGGGAVTGAIKTLLETINTNIAVLAGATVPTGGNNGRTAIATTGTAVALAASTSCKAVVVTAKSSNAGVIYVGTGAAPVVTAGNETGIPLYGNEKVTIAIDNLSKIYINGTSGDVVLFSYQT